jgi:hypothetical protein
MAEELAKSVRVPGNFRMVVEEAYTDNAGSLRRVFLGPASGFSAGRVEVPTSFPDASGEERGRYDTLPLRRWNFDETDCEVVLYQVTDPERLKFDLTGDQKARLDKDLDVAIEITGYCP